MTLTPRIARAAFSAALALLGIAAAIGGWGYGVTQDNGQVGAGFLPVALGKTVESPVTSVLQTTAGKMIFGRFIDSTAAAQAACAAPAAVDAEAVRRPRPQIPPSAAAAGK